MFDYWVAPVANRFGYQDCVNAYYNFICYMNFPRCDGAGNSLGVCTSVCENFFRACKYPVELWR